MALKRAIVSSLISALFALAGASAVGAQSNPDYTAPAPTVEVTSPPVQNIASSPVAQSSAAGLALTGTDALQLAAVGGVLVAGGAVALAARRRAIA